MRITKQDIAQYIESNPLLHGLTKDGLAGRREPFWPDPEPYPESLDTDRLNTIGDAIDWLRCPLDAGASISHRDELHPRETSYSLKHRFESQIGQYT